MGNLQTLNVIIFGSKAAVEWCNVSLCFDALEV